MDRFAGVESEADEDGGVHIHGAGLRLNCATYAELPRGDHTIAVLRAHGLRAEPDRAPLGTHRSPFRRLAVS